MKYRREIDGLRAVAILPVILFHAGFSVFSGGFVGVDVFFVISGYLIATIIITEIEQKNFSIARFYEKRARRILPALYFVMLTCFPFSFLWMSPSQFSDFSASLAATAAYFSNIYFLSQVDYFAADAELQPLLHTWSLAIEEQYYFLFPLMMLVMVRLKRRTITICIMCLMMISFLFAEWAWRENSARNFYFTLSRFWEISAGSICAFLTVGRPQRSSDALSMVGLLMIVFAIFTFSKATPFPSVYTLVPVVGAALVILFAAEKTWVARLLSLPVFVGIGLVSYSAYLWHQPLFAFARLRSITEPSHLIMAVLAVVAMLLAWVTWRYIEQPFRAHRSPALLSQTSVFWASGGIGLVFIAVGLAGHFGSGFAWRFDANVSRFIDASEDRADDACNFNLNAGLKSTLRHPQEHCLSNLSENPSVMLIGDSHMWALADGLRDALAAAEIENYFVSHTSCLPLNGFNIYGGAEISNYREFIEGSFEWATKNDVRTIVIAARFPLYLQGDRYNNGEGGVEPGLPGWVDLEEITDSRWDDKARHARVLAAYEDRILELTKRFNVVIIYPVPEAGWDVPSLGFKRALFQSDMTELTTSYFAYKERTRDVNALFDRLIERIPNAFGARVHEVLCSDTTGRCLNADGDGVYYYDDDHLSNAGARLVAPAIVQAIQDALLSDG
jgi:peptidoglycan/LPS O-acetylase OafA/YrhL